MPTVSEKKTRSQSGIEFRFVGPGWEDADKCAFKQRLPAVLALVQLTFQQLGVDFSVPPQVHLDRVRGGRGRPVGICYNGDLYSVSVKDQHIYGNARAALLTHTIVNVHEATHALRHRVTQDDDLMELLASEGLATYAHDASEQSFFGSKSALRDMTEDLGEVKLERWRQEFIADLEVHDDPGAIRDKWFNDSRNGYMLGLWCVDAAIGDGSSLADVIAMPTRDIVRAQ